MGAAAWEIRWLTPADAAAFQRQRLAGLRASPSAFGSSYEEEKDRSLAVIEARLAPSADQGVIGAFARSQLVGMLGIRRQDGLKTRHRMALWGVYVEPACRGQGIAQALLAQAVAFARQVPGAVRRQCQRDTPVRASRLPGLWHRAGGSAGRRRAAR